MNEEIKDLDWGAVMMLFLMLMNEEDREKLIEKFESDAVIDELNQIELEAMELD